jgi:hypothetical protein
MFLSSFDILRRDRCGNHTLVAVAGDLETARLRLSQFASLTPGEYFVFDHGPTRSLPLCTTGGPPGQVKVDPSCIDAPEEQPVDCYLAARHQAKGTTIWHHPILKIASKCLPQNF